MREVSPTVKDALPHGKIPHCSPILGPMVSLARHPTGKNLLFPACRKSELGSYLPIALPA